MENKQTAVEWLLSQIPLGIRMNLAENGIDLQQALAMEKAQMEELKDFEKWKEWKNEPQ
jgi:hypothetical protein